MMERLIFWKGGSQEMSVIAGVRPVVKGKFIFVGNEKLYIRGVTYGTFCPDEDGNEYHGPEVVERDFAQMAANGLNAVRTYSVPPRWLLDTAQRHNLRVMCGTALPGSARPGGGLPSAPPTRVTRPCCATRWATRSPRRWRAGSAAAGSSATWKGCTA